MGEKGQHNCVIGGEISENLLDDTLFWIGRLFYEKEFLSACDGFLFAMLSGLLCVYGQ